MSIIVTNNVSTVQPSEANTCEENRIKFCTDIAAISRGKSSSNNPEKRYLHLLKEAAPNECKENITGVAGRPLEFIPVVIKIDTSKLSNYKIPLFSLDGDLIASIHSHVLYNNIMKFSYMDPYITDADNELKLYTNLRALYNAGMPYEKIPYNKKEDLKCFKVVKVKAPYFVFAQIRTHGQISQIAASARVISENELWLPDDIVDRYVEYAAIESNKISIETLKEEIFNDRLSVREGQELLKTLGYKKEVYQRFYNHMLYKTWMMGGWYNDPKVWQHLFVERSNCKHHKNWTQETTKKVVRMIKDTIGV